MYPIFPFSNIPSIENIQRIDNLKNSMIAEAEKKINIIPSNNKLDESCDFNNLFQKNDDNV